MWKKLKHLLPIRVKERKKKKLVNIATFTVAVAIEIPEKKTKIM